MTPKPELSEQKRDELIHFFYEGRANRCSGITAEEIYLVISSLKAALDKEKELTERQGKGLIDAAHRLALSQTELQTERALREKVEKELEGERGVIAMVICRIDGEVEGRPTDRINFLQRIDQLVENENRRRVD